MWPYLGAEYGQNLEQSREQPSKVANPALGHRNREHILFPFPVTSSVSLFIFSTHTESGAL